MNQIPRRGFLSSLLPMLAGLPVVGKLFASEEIHGPIRENGSRRGQSATSYSITLPDVPVREVSEIHYIESDPNERIIKWISVKDRLPECIHYGPDIPGQNRYSNEVLVACHDGFRIGVWHEYRSESVDGKTQWLPCVSWLDDRRWYIERHPTHWAELPESPSGLVTVDYRFEDVSPGVCVARPTLTPWQVRELEKRVAMLHDGHGKRIILDNAIRDLKKL